MGLQICHHFAKAVPSACPTNKVRQLDASRISCEGSPHFCAERLRDLYVYPIPFLDCCWSIHVYTRFMGWEAHCRDKVGASQ